MPVSLSLFCVSLKSQEYVADMVGWEETRKVMQLPLCHFLHFNIETETSSVHMLKLGSARTGVVTKEEAEAKRMGEEQAKEARLEETQRLEDVERGRK